MVIQFCDCEKIISCERILDWRKARSETTSINLSGMLTDLPKERIRLICAQDVKKNSINLGLNRLRNPHTPPHGRDVCEASADSCSHLRTFSKRRANHESC